MIPLGIYAGARVATSLSVEYCTTIYETNPTGAKTWSGVSIGAEDTSRTVVLAIGYSGGGAGPITSVVIGGVTATIHITGAGYVTIASASLPTGTTADITVAGGSPSRYHVGIWRLTGGAATVIASNIYSYTDTATHEETITSASGGVLIAFSYMHGTSLTWTGVTERWDQLREAISGGADAATPSTTHTFTTTPAIATARKVIVATFGV